MTTDNSARLIVKNSGGIEQANFYIHLPNQQPDFDNSHEDSKFTPFFLYIFIGTLLNIDKGDQSVTMYNESHGWMRRIAINITSFSRLKVNDNPSKEYKIFNGYKTQKWTGTNPDRVIHFTKISAFPMPIIIPGTLYVSLAGNITHDLPRRISLELSITKYFFGVPFMIPCINSYIGSCTYENVCSRFERYEKHGCPRSMSYYGIQCHCPIKAADFSIVKIPVNVPKINGFASALLNGHYALRVAIVDESREELGCLEVKFALKKRHRGWIFKI
ncbi:hypothetical protein LOTGIDRAFT_157083 [Lottia gigantea]|uniref:MD-2-related lipid-recognition domain-containing protein n=1 Tax=Lottia gigantea TaxID=225164 RepID=V4CIG9_LOTGI|nr:hypothetical protein LOTGIDRAFT_157083 [Lottia gigantea]ESP01955.1 hypothetical protein LOTGIDRAFT_157083 [Lottia gigantea]